MYILILLLLLIIVFIFSNVVAYTGFEEKKFSISVYLWKIKLFSNKDKKNNKKEAPKEKENRGEPQKKLTLEALGGYFEVYKRISEDLKKMLRFFKRKIKAREFKLDITFGLSDAAETGIATGMVWAFIGSVYPVIDTIFEIRDPHISVNPKFNCEYFNLEYKGIYKLKIIHIIYIAFCALKLILKYKKVIKEINKNGGM